MSTTEINGHLARTRRTRRAILDALVDLLREGDLNPTATQIAARAGISKRTIFVHYASLEELHRDLAQHATAMVLEIVWPIDPDLPLEDRVDAICEQRAKVHEAIGPLRRAATARAATSAVAAESQRFSQRSSRDQITRVFAKELGLLDRPQRRRRVAIVDALLSGHTWDLWRTAYKLSVNDSHEAMRTALAALLRE